MIVLLDEAYDFSIDPLDAIEVVEIVKPALPPECWATPNPDCDYMAAVRASCGGGRS